MKKFDLWNNRKAIILILTIFLIATLSQVSAADDNNTANNDTITTHQIEQVHKEIKQDANEDYDEETDSEDEEIDDSNIYLTESNYEDYEDYEYEDNTNIIFMDSLENIYLELFNNNITVTGIEGVILRNSHLEIGGNDIVIANLTFESDDDSEFTQTILINGDNNRVDNVTFTDYRDTITDEYYRAVNVYGDNNIIINSAFNTTYPSMKINWDEGYTVECKSETLVTHGNNNTVANNSFLVYEGESKEYPYGTIYAMSIYGDNNTVDLNQILMNGTIYLYAIKLFNDNNIVTNNMMIVDSIRYANGISIENDANNNTLRNNTIIINTQDTQIDDENLTDAAYGIIITEYAYTGGTYGKNESKTSHNDLDGNTILGHSTHMYAIETFGGTKSTIRNNNIKVSGYSALGVATVGSGSTITNNKIEVSGVTNATQGSPDYLRPQTAGVYTYQGHDNVISGNEITSSHGAAIKTENEGNSVISNNMLTVNDNDVAINIVNNNGETKVDGNTLSNSITTFINQVFGDAINSQNNYIPSNEATEPETDDNQAEQTETNETETNEEPEIEPDPEPKTVEEPTNTTLPVENETEDINNTNVPDVVVDDLNITIPETNNETQKQQQEAEVTELNETPTVINTTESSATNNTISAGEQADTESDDTSQESEASEVMATAAATNSHVYEITKKLQDKVKDDVLLQILLLLILGLALTYGFTRNRGN